MLLRLAFFLAFLAPASIAGSALDARAPTGGWIVNFADAQCHAVRDYGSPQSPIQLILKSPAIGGVVQVAIVRKDPTTVAAQVKAWVTIDDRPPFKASMLTYTPRGSEFRVYMMNMAAAEFALVRQAKLLSVRTDELDERFSLSEMTPLLKIVDECVADLRRVFNVTDPETADASPLKRRARASLGRLLSSSDYPGVALERNQSGRVKFALLIDEHGRVADCTIVETSGVAALDAQACAILKTRATFQPALGSDGKPAKDALTAAVVWRLGF